MCAVAGRCVRIGAYCVVRDCQFYIQLVEEPRSESKWRNGSARGRGQRTTGERERAGPEERSGAGSRSDVR